MKRRTTRYAQYDEILHKLHGQRQNRSSAQSQEPVAQGRTIK